MEEYKRWTGTEKKTLLFNLPWMFCEDFDAKR
jgi:hypothetical protein